MRAIVLSAYGPPSALQLGDIAEPTPGPGEVKVRVVAAGVNPIDWKLRGGQYHKYMPAVFPAVLGRDVSGEVVALGAGVTSPAVGTRVLGFVNHSYAEFVVAPAESFATVPAGLDLVDAAALPLALLSGAQLVEDGAGVREGDTVLVTGATGGVGRAALFVAKARGATVYAGVRAAHAAEAAKLGARGVVALDDDRQLDTLPALDVLLDTVGGEPTQKLLGKLKAGGRVASVVGEPAGAKERGLAVKAILTHADSARLAALAAAVAADKLVIPVAKRFPLAQAAQAHEVAEKGGVGKIVLTL